MAGNEEYKSKKIPKYVSCFYYRYYANLSDHDGNRGGKSRLVRTETPH